MVARFSRCAVVTHWLPHTPVQIFFCLVLVHKKVWCCLSSLSIQTGVFAIIFRINLMFANFEGCKLEEGQDEIHFIHFMKFT